jgi:hypothetical protein
MIIDVIDMGDEYIASTVPNALDSACANSTRLNIYGMCNGVGEMLSAVQGVASAGSIDALRIWSHGMPGVQMVSGGQGYKGASKDYVAITIDNFTQLSPLTSLFSSSARVELRGCYVAAGGVGKALVLDLASMWNVQVYGSEVLQGDSDWIPPVLCASPSGQISTSTGPQIVDGNQLDENGNPALNSQ